MNPKTITKFLSSSIIIQVLNLLLSFIAINYLSISNLGRYNIAKSISGTLLYSNLGLRYALDRRLPNSGNNNLNNYSLKITLIINTIVSFIILIAFFIYYNFDVFYLVFGIGGIFVSSFTLLRVYFRARSNFVLFINSSFFGGILPLLAQIIGVIIWKLNGIIAGYLIANLVIFIIYLKKSKLVWHINLKKVSYIKKLFKAGILVYLTNLFVFLGASFDKILIESYNGLDFVGEYSIVTLVYTVSLLIPSAILEINLPNYVKSKMKFGPIAKNHIKYLSLLIILFLPASYLLLPYFVKLLFEQYIYLVDSMRICIFGILPFLIISPVYGILFANDKHYFILWSNLIATLLFFAALTFGLQNNFTFKELVWIKVLYSFIYSIVILFFFLRWQHSNKRKIR